MRKIRFFVIIFILAALLMECSSSKSVGLKINDVLTSNKTLDIDDSSNWKVYENTELGYKIVYPQTYEIQMSGGHSIAANPEYETRLSLYSKHGQLGLDIDVINKVLYKDNYGNIEEFIKYKQLNLKFDEDIIISGKHNKIYKLENDDYYFSFFENDKYIFQLSSSSKELLKKIMTNFNFAGVSINSA